MKRLLLIALIAVGCSAPENENKISYKVGSDLIREANLTQNEAEIKVKMIEASKVLNEMRDDSLKRSLLDEYGKTYRIIKAMHPAALEDKDILLMAPPPADI